MTDLKCPGFVTAICLLIGSGCMSTREPDLWRTAEGHDYRWVYEEYLRIHPNGPHVDEARRRIMNLEEQADLIRHQWFHESQELPDDLQAFLKKVLFNRKKGPRPIKMSIRMRSIPWSYTTDDPNHPDRKCRVTISSANVLPDYSLASFDGVVISMADSTFRARRLICVGDEFREVGPLGTPNPVEQRQWSD